MPSSWMATLLDQEQIEATSTIVSRGESIEFMPGRPGTDVATELGGRLLIRYLTASQVSEFNDGSTDRGHWVTTTAISPEDVVFWLALFSPLVPRQHALLLDPSQISEIRGPAWIRVGAGIEYFLPHGFAKAAIVDVGVIQVR